MHPPYLCAKPAKKASVSEEAPEALCCAWSLLEDDVWPVAWSLLWTALSIGRGSCAPGALLGMWAPPTRAGLAEHPPTHTHTPCLHYRGRGSRAQGPPVHSGTLGLVPHPFPDGKQPPPRGSHLFCLDLWQSCCSCIMHGVYPRAPSLPRRPVTSLPDGHPASDLPKCCLLWGVGSRHWGTALGGSPQSHALGWIERALRMAALPRLSPG